MSINNSNQIYFYPELGDTSFFATSVAINDKYLVVGDPGANRVVIYQKDLQGQWQRSYEIYPPENSIPNQVGSGFGTSLELDISALIIDATTTQATEDINNINDFTIIGNPNSVFFGKYFIQLDIELEVKPINITAKNKVGFAQFHILSEGKLKLVTLPDNNEELFAASIAVQNNLLLVGSPSRHIGGKGWLFDLKALDKQPIELTTKNAHIGDTVAISEEFIVVGNSGNRKFIKDDIVCPKTLIRSLKNDSTVVIETQGYLSLDGNVLAVMLPASRRLSRMTSRLQLFCLDENATPHLTLEHEYSRRGEKYLTQAWIQNGWLITVYRIGRMGSITLCLESVELLIGK